ncbi:hypothetical protein AJ80_08105 [Polytolypa hystricis UAMH7299]|uniref:RING-type domain-containing protein n=1 Tax=Polytolypa hystricis (strain UAMH7299) TaxID=1447883 RepID=A0A2B7XDM1_POLH7|nr:hypothetical protein AJ80_08105 [Polytolypa hystricis UAMH7299]
MAHQLETPNPDQRVPGGGTEDSPLPLHVDLPVIASGPEVKLPSPLSLNDALSPELACEKNNNEIEDASPLNVVDNNGAPKGDNSGILVNFPPEIVRGNYLSMSGKKPKPGLNPKLPPISNIQEIFDDLAVNAEQNGFSEFLRYIGARKLRVATMCSGTEAPLLALQMISDSFKRLFGQTFNMHHLFSAEIDPFKQSYIQRNFSPDILFRDVNELVADEATTAFGSLRQVPTDPDLLVVGFSCVDFSNLNLHRKALDEMGESGHTFYGILRYAQRCRPPLIVLENVCSAPWAFLKETFAEINYNAYHVKIDTKDYYLPQTRERGYMLCIDRAKLETEPAESKRSPFSAMMKKLERPASSPVTQFLLKNSDPRLQDGIDDISMISVKDRQAVDWTRYKARHVAYRMREGLGAKRPLSRWQDNGNCQMPDFYWHDWTKSQTERVWDTLDVNYLRTLIRGYDINFKSRVIDLSQGLDRELDLRASGVAGCLTPRGQHFVTSRGGPLLGIEALALQGIPIDRLILSSDAQRELHDLAGNAMSSTVVGAAIVSALILGHKALLPASSDEDVLMEEVPASRQILPVNSEAITTLPVGELECGIMTVADILDGSIRSARLCYCESQALVKRRDVLRCSKCGHTACARCGRNSSHEYEQISEKELNERTLPIEFEIELKRKLPMRLQINGLTSDMFRVLRTTNVPSEGKEAWDAFLHVLEPALQEELRFHTIERSGSWTITYRGPHSILKLTCSSLGLQWSLFILPPKDGPSNSPLRQMLLLPIAQMHPSGDNLLDGSWRIYSPVSFPFDIIVTSRGERVPSIGSKVGLQHPDFVDSKVWNQLNISAGDTDIGNLEFDIRGDYELLQDCEAACGSLHKRIPLGSEQPLYLFLDPTEIGPAELDSWVFSFDHSRLDPGQARSTVAQISPNWSASNLSEVPTRVRCWYRKWAGQEEVSLENFLASTSAIYQMPLSRLVTNMGGLDCQQSYIPMLMCSVPATGSERTLAPGTWNKSDPIESPVIFEDFAWLLQKASSIGQYTEWKQIDRSDNSLDCHVCAPPKPRIMWTLSEKGQVCPYENPEDAAIYERSIKQRPSSFLTFTRLDHESKVQFQISLNVLTLLHQARGRIANAKDVTLQWRLCIDSVGYLRQPLPKLEEKNNRHDHESAQPPGFINFPLRPEQLRSLNWMKEREGDDVQPFEEQEVVEAMIPAINWRAEGKASTSVLVRGGILGDDVGYGKTAVTLGLIDSHHVKDSRSVPGFADGAIPVKATLIVVPHHLVDQWFREIKKFLRNKYNVLQLKSIASLRQLTIERVQKADIILVSASVLRGASYYAKMESFAATPVVPKGEGRIFDEWIKDAMAGIKEHVNLLVKSGSEAVLRSIVAKHEEFQAAGGYLKYRPSRRLKGEKLKEHLSKLKKSLDSIQEEGEVVEDVDHELQPTVLGGKGTKRKRDPQGDSNEGKDQSPTLINRQASSGTAKRLKTEKPLESSEPGSEADKTFHLRLCKSDWTKLHSPLIHMFEFNRLVIDEFTYSKDRNYSSALAISARKKWILSGTPPLNDFADVKTFSPFLGISLGIDDNERAKPENERLRTIQRELTDAEQFQPFVTRHSAAWHERRHEIAQTLLDQFMRKNTPDIDEIPWTEYICEVTLSPPERATYIELYMQLVAQNLRLRRSGRGAYDTAEVARLNTILGNSYGPEEALLRCCCLFSGDNLSSRKGETSKSDSGSISEGLTDNPPNHASPDGSLKSDDGASSSKSEKSGKSIAEKRRQQLRDVVADIGDSMRRGLWLRSHVEADLVHFDTLLESIQNNALGDWHVTKELEKMVLFLKEGQSPDDGMMYYLAPQEKKEKPSDPRAEFPKTQTEFTSDLNYCTDSLRRLTHEAISRTRALRLLDAVTSFQPNSSTTSFGCHVCFFTSPDPVHFSILGDCGHTVCELCLAKCTLTEECPFHKCTGSVQSFRIVKPGELGWLKRDGPMDESWQAYGGSKFKELINLLQDASRIAPEDQVLLFIQFADVMEAASAALGTAGIPHLMVGANDRMAAAKITQFQMGTEKLKSKILILNLGDVTASGLNLQNANHIIFLSPLCARSQYDYTSGMAQAIGRSRRYGQQKHVHIYHFLTLNTIEVNIFEQRRQQHLAKRNKRFIPVSRDDLLASDELGWRGTSLDGSKSDWYH